MAAEHRADFFEGVQKHSQIKLRALERYLPPWSGKVGSRQGVKRLWVVDGFAGPGTYDDGEPGSPSIALRHAEKQRGADTRYKVSCIFVEKRGDLYQKLRRVCSDYPTIERFPLRGNFWDQIDKIVDLIGDDPSLVFVDPFGLGDLKFDPLVDLCNRLHKVDLMVNFASPVAKRLKREHEDLVSASVGGPGWTVDKITHTFCTRLEERCRFLQPAVLPVHANVGKRDLKYEIVLAARKRDAYELWSDEISSSQRDILDGEDQTAKLDLLESACAQLRLVVGETFTRDRLIKDIQFHRCGDFHSRVLRAAVKEMLDEGEWKRDPGPVGTARIRKV